MRLLTTVFLLVSCASSALGAWSHDGQTPRLPPDKDDRGVLVVDGSFVHDVGELQLNITNWGLIGSHPREVATYSSAPSAMWPAGSGVDYLFAAGLWVGGIKNGVPLVTTGQFENEMQAKGGPVDTIYEMAEGDPGGARYPYPNEDDDGDGRANEDPKNGLDDDGDGAVDEDFAAIGQQHFRLTMVDDLPVVREQWPDHDPLGIEVLQESFQWSNPSLEDVVGFQYTIRNMSNVTIEDLVLGFFADADAGPRNDASVGQDDAVGFYEGTVEASDGAPLTLSVAYVYDCDGDGGVTPGYIGFLFVNATKPPLPVPITSFRFFAGTASFEAGGDPTNDAQRYELMTTPYHDAPSADCRRANDYRILISFRPSGGARFEPGESTTFQMAIVMGDGLNDLIENASEAVLTYYGRWFNRDGDFTTGTNGRERKLCRADFGGDLSPILGRYVDCGYPVDCRFAPPYVVRSVDLDRDGCVWINGDCSYEQTRGVECGDCMSFDEPSACTGRRGREFNVHWISDAPPPIPPTRLHEDDDSIHLFWANDAEFETERDGGLPLFEAYRVWRADGWDRPPGSSRETGPPSDLWRMIAQFDLVDSYIHVSGDARETLPLGPNTGLDAIGYVPPLLREGSEEAEEFADLSRLIDDILAAHPELPARARIRFLDERGVVTPLGEEFAGLADWECCYAQLDTLLMSKQGLHFYEFVDRDALNGFQYFYSVTTATRQYGSFGSTATGYGPAGHPRSNTMFGVPQSAAQTAEDAGRNGPAVFVVPNPATRASLAEFGQLHPNADDPSGVRIEFRNLPRARNVVKIYTISGDLVATLRHDGRDGAGSLPWNLVSRNGQEIVSGIYLYSVECDDSRFDRVVGRFVVVR